MNSFIAPVYIKLGKLSDEKLLCGLFMINSSQIDFQFSIKRLQLVAQVSGNGTFELSKTVLEQIKHKVQQTNVEIKKASKTAFPLNHIFNVEYFEYLKKYGQNTVLVGEIQPIADYIDFQTLYEKTLNEKPESPKIHKTSFHSKIKNIFKNPKVEEKADIGLKIQPKQLPGLNYDTTVALIAKNGCVLAADTLDFTSSSTSIGNTLNAFDVLVFSLIKYGENHKLKKGKFHLLVNEPLSGSEQEKIFNTIYKNKNKLYDFDLEEKTNEIIDEIVGKEYKKFSLYI